MGFQTHGRVRRLDGCDSDRVILVLVGGRGRKRHPPQPAQPPSHQRLGSATAETTPAGAPAAAADRTQRPDATCEGTNG